MLPSHVRVFWWFSVAIAAYWSLSSVWFVAFPSEHYLALLQRLPPESRVAARRMEIIPLAATLFWCGLTLGTAWLAAFRRENWARWTYAFVFLSRELLLWIVLAYVYLVQGYDDLFRHAFLERFWKSTAAEWSNPRHYVIPVLTVIAIVAVFTGNAKEWFRRPKSPTSPVAIGDS